MASSTHGVREGEAPVALLLEGATRAPMVAGCILQREQGERGEKRK
jgi:hypothetical protein